MMINRILANNVLTQAQFKIVADLAYREAGLAISPSKNAMVFSRLGKRMKVLGLRDIDGYCQHLQSTTDPNELGNLVCALTTNVTQFFREPHHFELLRAQFSKFWSARAREGQILRFWSAGCSTGMEPYSIAMTVADVLPDFEKWDIRILATDIDHEMIEQARQGIYPYQSTTYIPEHLRDTMLEPCNVDGRTNMAAAHCDHRAIRPDIRSLVTFNTHNLIRPWPMRHAFDAIFCRNVVIYFDEATQNRLWPKFAAVTAQNGRFFLGHSERMPGHENLGYRQIGLTAYQMSSPLSAPIFQKENSYGAS